MHIKSTIFQTSSCFNWATSPFGCIVFVRAIFLVCKAWTLSCSNSQACKICAWDWNSGFCICYVSITWNVSPIINTLKSLSFFPPKFNRLKKPSCFVNTAWLIKKLCETCFIVSTILVDNACWHWWRWNRSFSFCLFKRKST